MAACADSNWMTPPVTRELRQFRSTHGPAGQRTEPRAERSLGGSGLKMGSIDSISPRTRSTASCPIPPIRQRSPRALYPPCSPIGRTALGRHTRRRRQRAPEPRCARPAPLLSHRPFTRTANSTVNLLLQDSEGTVWASTDGGIAAIDPRSFAVRTLGSRRVLQYQTIGLPLAPAPRLGNCCSAARGPHSHQTSRVGAMDLSPTARDNQRAPRRPARAAGRLNETGSAAPLTIAPEGNSLSVEFAALDFSAPEQNQYAYRLDGLIGTGSGRPASASGRLHKLTPG